MAKGGHVIPLGANFRNSTPYLQLQIRHNTQFVNCELPAGALTALYVDCAYKC